MEASKTESAPLVVERARLRPWVIGFVGFALLCLLFWSMNVRATKMKDDGIRQGIDALSVAIAPSVLEAKSGQLRQLAQAIVQHANFQAMTITRPDGQTITSTNNLAMVDLKGLGINECRIEHKNGHIEVTRLVNIGGDNSVGAMRIEISE